MSSVIPHGAATGSGANRPSLPCIAPLKCICAPTCALARALRARHKTQSVRVTVVFLEFIFSFMGWRARCPRIGDAWAPTKSNTGRKYENKQCRDNFSTAKTSLPDDSVRCGRHRFGGLTEQANARSTANLGVGPAAHISWRCPQGIRGGKGHPPPQSRSPWHRGRRNASALSPHATRSSLKKLH